MFFSENSGSERNSKKNGNIRRGSGKVRGRFFLLLMVMLCVMTAVCSPALAKKAKKKNAQNKKKAARMQQKAEWADGTWEDGCYVSGEGLTKASIEQMDQRPVPKIKGLKKQPILYIGASRVVRASKAVKDKDVFFYGIKGANLREFFVRKIPGKKQIYPMYMVIRAYLKARPRGTVIIDMGGNDLENIEAYIGFYNELLNKYPDATFYFKGPMPREIGDTSNGERLDFNIRLEEEFPGHVINQFTEVYELPGFTTIDGVHYPPRQIRRVYQMMMEKIGRPVSVNIKTGKVTAIKG